MLPAIRECLANGIIGCLCPSEYDLSRASPSQINRPGQDGHTSACWTEASECRLNHCTLPCIAQAAALLGLHQQQSTIMGTCC